MPLLPGYRIALSPVTQYKLPKRAAVNSESASAAAAAAGELRVEVEEEEVEVWLEVEGGGRRKV